MTAGGLTGTDNLDFINGETRDSQSQDEDASRPDTAWSQTGKIGVVENGSLEEEIWRELGALPRSRQVNLRKS